MIADVPPLASEELRPLAALGFHAIFAGHPERARVLFEALARLRPDDVCARVGVALCLLGQGKVEGAVRLLEQACGEQPDDPDLTAILGLALHLARRGTQSRAVLAPLLDGAHGSPASQLAQQLLPPLFPLQAD